jgi:hypothetical protein
MVVQIRLNRRSFPVAPKSQPTKARKATDGLLNTLRRFVDRRRILTQRLLGVIGGQYDGDFLFREHFVESSACSSRAPADSHRPVSSAGGMKLKTFAQAIASVLPLYPRGYCAGDMTETACYSNSIGITSLRWPPAVAFVRQPRLCHAPNSTRGCSSLFGLPARGEARK